MSGFEPFLFGAAASGGAAATSGIIGTAGAFSAATTAGTLASAAAIGGTLAAADSARQQGKAAQRAGEYNAQSALMEAKSRESAQRADSQRSLARIRANIGKSGATSAGTPLLVLAESAANAEIDALNTRFTASRQADVYRAGGANARTQGNIMAGTSLLQGAGKFA